MFKNNFFTKHLLATASGTSQNTYHLELQNETIALPTNITITDSNNIDIPMFLQFLTLVISLYLIVFSWLLLFVVQMIPVLVVLSFYTENKQNT